MSRRERLKKKLERRLEWASSRKEQAAISFERADLSEEKSGIPLGQPILVGHHSERRHRRAIERAHNAMEKAVESQNMAEHHRAKAAGLAAQLENTIYSDDSDAVEALEARIQEREQQAEKWKSLNTAWRKSKGDFARFAELAEISEEAAGKIAQKVAASYSWDKKPCPGYRLSNLRQRINADKKRLEQVKAQQARAELAEESGGVAIEGGEWVRITFAEKPAREILASLKAAGFHWRGGSWCGLRENIPEGVAAS